mmetsp:Transcript_6050/g.13179  ORF Transcript_6050/g.13179 Transcript_6050/m.13179 type:complete len:317 (-) Transcript_6050:88-1038(-)
MPRTSRSSSTSNRHSSSRRDEDGLRGTRFLGFGGFLDSWSDEDDYTYDTRDTRDDDSIDSSSDDDESYRAGQARRDRHREQRTSRPRHHRGRVRADTLDTFDPDTESDDDDNSTLSAPSIGWNCSSANGGRLAGNGKVDSNNFFSAVSFVVSNIAREIRDGPPDDNEQAAVATLEPTTDAEVATDNSALQAPSSDEKEQQGNGAALDKANALVNEERCKGTVVDTRNKTSFVHIVESDNSSERLLSQPSSSSLSNTSQILKTPSKLPRFKLRSSRPSKKERKEQERKEQERIAAAKAERRERRRNMTVTRITVTQE